MQVSDLIKKSLQLIGVVAAGETPSPEDLNDGFDKLNMLVRSWNAQQLPLFAISKQTVTLTGANSYNLATRTLRIKSATVITSIGTSQSPAIVDVLGWNGIPDKTRTGVFAESLFCDYAYPTAAVYLTPRPASGTLEIWAHPALAQFTSTSQVIDLPDGFERALCYALAIDLAPEYGRSAPPEVVDIANESKNAITQLNAIVMGEMAPGSGATAQTAA